MAFTRFLHLLSLDRWDVVMLFVYNLASAILALAIPLAAQALVTSVAQGLFLQPLLVLTCAVAFGLLISGLLKTMQMAVAESVQERLFARLAVRVADLLPRFERTAYVRANGAELINRFFEIANLQKSWYKLLLDVPTSLVEILIAFSFLALFGDNLWQLCVSVTVAATLVLLLLGWGGLRSSLKESKAKYELASWLEQMARSQAALPLARPGYWLEKADDIIVGYLKYRRSHFGVLLRQTGAFYLINAAGIATLLGFGGWLVIGRSLTIGQLVAAELVVLNLLKATEKLIRAASSWYDLLTSLDKLGQLTSIDTLPESSATPLTPGVVAVCRSVGFRYQQETPLLEEVDLELKPGERVTILGAEGCGKSTLAALVAGAMLPQRGQLEVTGSVSWLQHDAELFEMTLEENLRLGRDVSAHDLRWAMQASGLHDQLALQTPITCGGRNLSSSQVARIALARAILGRPSLLILDSGLTAVSGAGLESLLEELMNKKHLWTVLNLIPHPAALAASDRILTLKGGRLTCSP